MSTLASLSSLFFVGQVLMIVAAATRGKGRRTKGFESFGTSDELEDARMIFIALLWPIWRLAMLARK